MSQRTATTLMAVSIVDARKVLQEMDLSVQVFTIMVLMDNNSIILCEHNNYKNYIGPSYYNIICMQSPE